MKLLSCLTILTALFVTEAQALPRGTVGNGGDVLVCNVNGNYTYTILDHHEGEEFYKLKYDFPQKDTWREIVEDVIQIRLKKYAVIRAARYMNWLEAFMDDKEIDFITGKTLNDVPDSNHISIPNNCVLKQIAIQRSEKELKWGGKRYTVNQDLWKELDERQKAVLVLHEIILRDTIELEYENSIPARYLNTYLFAKIHLETSTDAVYSELEKVFPGAVVNEIKNLPFGSKFLKEKVVFLMDKSGSNGQTDGDKKKRELTFLNLHKKYFATDFSQTLIVHGDGGTHTDWTSNKFEFLDTYYNYLNKPEVSSSNIEVAVKYLEKDVYDLKSENFERLHVVFMIDGEATAGDTNLLRVFENLIKQSKNLAIKYHFVLYGRPIPDFEEVVNRLNGKVYDSETLGNIEF